MSNPYDIGRPSTVVSSTSVLVQGLRCDFVHDPLVRKVFGRVFCQFIYLRLISTYLVPWIFQYKFNRETGRHVCLTLGSLWTKLSETIETRDRVPDRPCVNHFGLTGQVVSEDTPTDIRGLSWSNCTGGMDLGVRVRSRRSWTETEPNSGRPVWYRTGTGGISWVSRVWTLDSTTSGVVSFIGKSLVVLRSWFQTRSSFRLFPRKRYSSLSSVRRTHLEKKNPPTFKIF